MASRQETEIRVLSDILRFIREESYEDRDDFASNLAAVFVESLVTADSRGFFYKKAINIRTNFFRINRVKKTEFLDAVFKNLSKKGIKPPLEGLANPQLSFADLFPEIRRIKDSQVSGIEHKLNIKEEIIQNTLRDALRERGAAPIARRGKDSPLEVADLEHFSMPVRGKQYGFSAVVKGYNSIKGKKVSWEDVAHQITKANRTKPNYILFLTAKEPKDGVISEMKTYGSDTGNPNLVVFVPPLDVAKFLVWKKLLDL